MNMSATNDYEDRNSLKRPEIVEVIQFGSSVYAPEHARDVDLLIITKNPRDYDGYLDAVEEVSPPFNVDIVVIGLYPFSW